MGKQITLTFYFFTWSVIGKQNNTVKFVVPVFRGVPGCSGVPECSGVPGFSTCHPDAPLIEFFNKIIFKFLKDAALCGKKTKKPITLLRYDEKSPFLH